VGGRLSLCGARATIVDTTAAGWGPAQPPPLAAAAAAHRKLGSPLAAACPLLPSGASHRTTPAPPIDAPCTQCLRHGDLIHARKALTAAAALAAAAAAAPGAAASSSPPAIPLTPCPLSCGVGRRSSLA
jgi:hypothetical protein